MCYLHRQKKKKILTLRYNSKFDMFLVFCLLQNLSSTHLTLHPLDLKTTPPHPSWILQLNKYLTQANVSSPGISFDTIKHSNHIDDNVFVIQFLIWGQRKTGFPHPFMHAWRVTHHGLYTDKYIWYMSSTCSHTSYGMLADELIGFTARRLSSEADGTLQLEWGASNVRNNAFWKPPT